VEWRIESEVVAVPTEYVRVNGARMDFDDFAASARFLKSLTRAPRSVGAIQERWLKEWESRGVIERYVERVPPAFGEEERGWSEQRMAKAGVEHKAFVAALKTFEVIISTPQAQAARARRKLERSADLVDLRGPSKFQLRRGVRPEWPEVVEFW
jgi:hypothetical protein